MLLRYDTCMPKLSSHLIPHLPPLSSPSAPATRLDIDGEELGAEALHLLLDGRAGVERAHDGAQVLGRADRRQAGHAAADDQYLGRGHLRGGGGAS